ncbi:MAG: GNAT family N-acetyltransferase [Actinomycetota bacterium]
MVMLRPLVPHPLDIAAARTTLAEAFVDDPLMAWMFPDLRLRPHFAAAWMGVFIEAYAAGAHIDLLVDDQAAADPAAVPAVVGAAVWRLNEAPLPFAPLPGLGPLMEAFMGGQRAIDVGVGLAAFAENKPDPPYHYLMFLGVHPAQQGRGLGRRLVAAGQARAASEGAGVYLESTNARNLSFYRSMGLQQVGDFVLEPAGPPVYRMWWHE